MAITVRPWDGSQYSANVDPDSYHVSAFTTNPQVECVLAGWGNEFKLSGTSSPIVVGSGRAFVNGKEIISSADEPLAIPTPTTATRVDLIALEIDYVNKTENAAIVRVAGVEGAGGAKGPIWQPGTKVQVPIGTVSITTAGICTCTPAAGRFLHFATRVAGAMLDADMVDGITLEVAGGALRVKNAGIDASQLADNAVDDTKVGARVPALVRRQGGSATQWGAPGTTTYTPGAVLVQAGSVTWAETPYVSGLVVVTFPVPFSSPPLVFCQAATGSVVAYPFTGTIMKNQFTAYWDTWTDNKSSVDILWLAIGPE